MEIETTITESEEVTPPAGPAVVVVTPPPVESGLSEADAIELADLRRERDERIARETAEATVAAELALAVANAALENSQESEEVEVPAPAVEEEKEEPKEDTPPNREHPFFKKF